MPKTKAQTKAPGFCKFYLISQLSCTHYNPQGFIYQDNALTTKLSIWNVFNISEIAIECFIVVDQQNWDGIWTYLTTQETDGVENIQM